MPVWQDGERWRGTVWAHGRQVHRRGATKAEVTRKLELAQGAHQFQVRQAAAQRDLDELVDSLRTADFTFEAIDAEDTEGCREVARFIERHEWLGTMPNRPTHRFVARLGRQVGGAVVFAIPYRFSGLLGERTEVYERVLARGASISWAPRNLGSWLITRSIEWMVSHTDHRLFVGYADGEAGESGGIYRALGWRCVGRKAGATEQYREPGGTRWFTSRHFRKRTQMLKYARELGRHDELRAAYDDHRHRWTPDWTQVPHDLREQLRELQAAHMARCERRVPPPKTKWATIRGRDRREQRQLEQLAGWR